MRLATIFRRHAGTIGLPAHQHRAMQAIIGCRTRRQRQFAMECEPCGHREWLPHSCGHRSCPRCQNHCASRWLDQQRGKLLPCTYYLVTFTLPASLRAIARRAPAIVYDALMDCAASTLKTFAVNEPSMGNRIGMTAILHTHSRSRGFHPHVHIVMPGGGLSADRRVWRAKPGSYLFNAHALSMVFRARVLAQLADAGIRVGKVPRKWIVHCKQVGSGLPALQYLSRYLYRGVMPEKDILSERNGVVRFRYRDNRGQSVIRALPAEQFLRLVLQHVLPRGFRRIRDYGFHNGNARETLRRVQWALQVVLPPQTVREPPTRRCARCGGVMRTIGKRPEIREEQSAHSIPDG